MQLKLNFRIVSDNQVNNSQAFICTSIDGCSIILNELRVLYSKEETLVGVCGQKPSTFGAPYCATYQRADLCTEILIWRINYDILGKLNLLVTPDLESYILSVFETELKVQLDNFIKKSKNKKLKNMEAFKTKSLASALKGSYDPGEVKKVFDLIVKDKELFYKLSNWIVDHPSYLDVDVEQAVREASIKHILT